jgi:hypothetical protein
LLWCLQESYNNISSVYMLASAESGQKVKSCSRQHVSSLQRHVIILPFAPCHVYKSVRFRLIFSKLWIRFAALLRQSK